MDMTLHQYANAALQSVLATAKKLGMPPGPMVLFEGGSRRGTVVLDGFIDASEKTQREAADMLRQTIHNMEATRYAVIGAAWAIPSRPDGRVPLDFEGEADRFEVVFVYAENADEAVAFVVRPNFADDGRLLSIEHEPEEAEAIPNKLLSGILKRKETIQ